MADTRQPNQQGSGEGARERGRAAASDMAAATRRGAEAAREAAGTEEREERVVQQGATALREGAHGGADMLRRGGEAGRRSAAVLGETARVGMQALGTGQEHILNQAAREVQMAGRGLAEMVEETTEGIRSLMAMPGFSGDGMREAQQAVSRLMDGVIATNLRLTRELMHHAGPSAFIGLQRRFVRDWFDALAEGGTVLLHATRQAAEESLRPLEQQRQRRSADHGSGRVCDVMSTDVRVATPEDSVQQAAKLMSETDTGVLPVREGDRLVGMVTDRDVAIRLVAEGKDPARTKVREVMSPEVRYVFEDEGLEHVAENMAEQQLRRLPVVNREKRLVGILSLGDIARQERGRDLAGRALGGVTREGGQHHQGAAPQMYNG
ncbi:MAG: CBS domain-containing protein [Acetobacteraceae bacterium]|nr:CBS domain-containing protein [Acetobacteraceae bacterium]